MSDQELKLAAGTEKAGAHGAAFGHIHHSSSSITLQYTTIREESKETHNRLD
jgi:hypothetical protein